MAMEAAAGPVMFKNNAIKESPEEYLGGDTELQEVKHVRKLFPETWLWINTSTTRWVTVCGGGLFMNTMLMKICVFSANLLLVCFVSVLLSGQT